MLHLTQHLRKESVPIAMVDSTLSSNLRRFESLERAADVAYILRRWLLGFGESIVLDPQEYELNGLAEPTG